MNSPPASGTARSHTKHTGEQRFRRRARKAMTRHAPLRAKGGPKPLRQTDVLRLAGNRSDLRSARNIPGMTRSNQMASIATRCNRSMEEGWAAQPRIMRTIPSAAGPGSRFSSPAAAPGIPVSGRTRAGRACAMTHGRPTGTMQRMPRRSERPRPRTLEVRISRAGIGLAPASTTGGDHDSSHFLVSLAFSIVGPVPLMEYRHRPLLQKITSRVTPALQCSSR